MNQKSFSTITGAFFLLVALLHLMRATYAWEAVIGGAVIPIWASWIAVVVAGYLSYSAFNQARK